MKGRKTSKRLQFRRALWDKQSEELKKATRRPGSLKKPQPVKK